MQDFINGKEGYKMDCFFLSLALPIDVMLEEPEEENTRFY
jgi:hypothetical protein